MSKTIGKATLEADEDGLVTLQCVRCKSRFKVECEYLNEELEGKDICCPVCGISEQLNTFWPEEVVEEAKKIALMEAEQMISDAFKGFNSKYIKVKTNPVKRVDRSIILKNKDYDMHQIIINCCNKKMALMPSDIVAGFYCPYCGRIVK
ncbi:MULTISPECIES: hypothetical protein [Bacillota]|uniref:hypothetical protein n=1 Tax=Bacillota TaxID=1239 RepID=UPI000B441725|nr:MULTISPECIES: hypothetical protein [Bacillota]OUN34096.1 hypothetical protein B5G32_09345 [Massilimicrobiota sp. An80]QUN13299.1 hypothetical protein KEC48_01875 [Clostridium sp. C1]